MRDTHRPGVQQDLPLLSLIHGPPFPSGVNSPGVLGSTWSPVSSHQSLTREERAESTKGQAPGSCKEGVSSQANAPACLSELSLQRGVLFGEKRGEGLLSSPTQDLARGSPRCREEQPRSGPSLHCSAWLHSAL